MRIYEIPVKDRVLIVPFGDIQFTGSDPATKGGCSINYLRHFLSQVKKIAKGLRADIKWIGTGDYVDLISPSNRAGYMASGLYSPAKRVISKAIGDIVGELHEVLSEYIRGRDIVTLCRGHHWFSYDDELDLPYGDTDTHLASLFGLAKRHDRGVCVSAGLADFKFGEYKNGAFQPSGAVYRTLFQHGEGNGATLTYGLNKLDKMAGSWESVHCFVMGHTHKVGAIKKARFDMKDGKIVHHDIRMITSGSFLRSWLVDQVLYPEQKQMGPVPLGGAAVYVERDESQPDGHASFSIEI